MPDAWNKTAPASFTPDDGDEILFPVISREKQSGNRIVHRKRPYRPGEKLDNTGEIADEFSVTALFTTEIDEPALGLDPPLWPDRINLLDAALRSSKTGTLHLPWERDIRCRPEKWTRSASTGVRNAEQMTITFVRDNEDSLDPSQITEVSVGGSLAGAVEEATFDADSLGEWDGDFSELTEFAAELEGALNAPGEMLSDIQAKADQVQRACESIDNSLGLSDPETGILQRKLLQIKDAAARSAGQTKAGERRTTTRSYQHDTDLYSVAAELGQSVGELLALNPGLEDPTFILAGVQIRVYAT